MKARAARSSLFLCVGLWYNSGSRLPLTWPSPYFSNYYGGKRSELKGTRQCPWTSHRWVYTSSVRGAETWNLGRSQSILWPSVNDDRYPNRRNRRHLSGKNCLQHWRLYGISWICYKRRYGVIYLERLVSLSKITYTYSERFHEKRGIWRCFVWCFVRIITF